MAGQKPPERNHVTQMIPSLLLARSVPFAGLLAGLKPTGLSPAKCPAKSPAKRIAPQKSKLGLPNSSLGNFCPAILWFKYHVIKEISIIIWPRQLENRRSVKPKLKSRPILPSVEPFSQFMNHAPLPINSRGILYISTISPLPLQLA